MKAVSTARLVLAMLAVVAAGLASCRRTGVDDRRLADVDSRVRARWGKGLAELPAVKLSVITPHNENIQSEFDWAFSLHHALAYGQRIEIEYVDVGGGGSSIEKYLQNVYEQRDSSHIDVLWGGGDVVFNALRRPTRRHEEGLLEPLRLPPDVLEQIPAQFGGIAFREPSEKKMRWIGSAVSSFGFLYNAGMMEHCGIRPAPARWDDLGEDRFTDLLVLADPSQSSSVANVYRLIVTSETTWPAGWAKLIGVLSNAKRVSDSAGQAVNAPVLGDALVATCIDFYGILRVAEAPSDLVYVSPEGQTPFTPDPIAILRNPPNPLEAQRFVEFVLSARGQALWALPVGDVDGPARTVLGRVPIRRDVFELYRGRLIPRTVNFYQSRQTMQVSPEMARINSEVLRMLVIAACVDTTDDMRAARRRLNELAAAAARPGADPAARAEYLRRLALFTRLSEDVDTLEKMNALPRTFRVPDAQRAEQIARAFRAANGREMTQAEQVAQLAAAYRRDLRAVDRVSRAWRDYFRSMYQEVAR